VTLRRTPLLFLLAAGLLNAHDLPDQPPSWTHYLRMGAAQEESSSGAMGFYRIKRIHGNTFHDLRVLGMHLQDATIATARYKSSQKFTSAPKFYRFTVMSLRHNSISDLKIRYHYNQGFGGFVFEKPTTHLTAEAALSYDMSDYLSDTRKTSYFKWGLFWDVDIGPTSLALDFEYFNQVSDVVPGEADQSRYELSGELNFPLKNRIQITFGYEEEFYRDNVNSNVRSIYIALGIKKSLGIKY